MPENKAVGLDKISSRLLRIVAPIISKPLTPIINKSLQNGKFLTEWKHVKVIPLLKSGPTIERNNYRPISILPILSKVLERFVHSCYSDYLTEFKLFTIANQDSENFTLHLHFLSILLTDGFQIFIKA